MWCVSLAVIVHTLVLLLVAGSHVLFVKNKVPLVQTALNEGESVLVTLASQAGLADLLNKPGNLTLFGPTDDAFFELPLDIRQALENDNQTRVEFLKYHIVNQTIHKSQLKNEATFNTLSGQPVRINFYHNNTVCSGKTNLNDTALGPLTLFGPTNDAFAKLPKGAVDGLLQNTTALKELMYYHVVLNTYYRAGMETGTLKTLNGKSLNLTVSLDEVKVNGANLISEDNSVVNGVIHMVDTVLTPP
ncbi:transforming growth factor-beta-induced protein ig-h3-like [Ylistrum balloti]|uniref:transforming growth factor-beta-induced protein ig-h3-like n=1 Tax=Ylistrum balloti TaxID=509963 RepID=UPI002905A93E|nr:transforming growth factor-beta-induced protein ig-h3-like [Ylistrum balloti]